MRLTRAMAMGPRMSVRMVPMSAMTARTKTLIDIETVHARTTSLLRNMSRTARHWYRSDRSSVPPTSHEYAQTKGSDGRKIHVAKPTATKTTEQIITMRGGPKTGWYVNLFALFLSLSEVPFPAVPVRGLERERERVWE